MSIIGCNNQNSTKEQPSVTEKSSSDWVKYRVEDNGTVHSYKKGKIEKNRRKYVVQVWEKQVFSDQGREKYIQNRTKEGFPTKGYDKLLYRLVLYEINCKKKKGGILSVTYYDMNRKILDFWNLDAIKWKYINPDTTSEIIQKGVCK
jgi:hypothetical protein